MHGTAHANAISADDGAATAVAIPDRTHPTVDLATIGTRIRTLHEQVCGHGRRVEVTRDGCDEVAVLISRRELDAIEAALSYYAAHDHHTAACRGLAKLLAEAGLVYTPRAYLDGEPVPTFADDCGGVAGE